MTDYDSVIVGAGPNGLAAGIRLAQAGRRVLVMEQADEVGGGVRSAALTLPGFTHDICSAIHPMAYASPFLGGLPLRRYGLRWVHPSAPVAHPLDDGRAVLVGRSVKETAAQFGRDAGAYYALMAPLVRHLPQILAMFMRPWPAPAQPLTFARFGLRALWPAAALARALFRRPEARALLAGHAAHTMVALEEPATAAAGLLLLALAHATGWPFPRGGARAIPRAMAALLRDLGGQVQTGRMVRSLDDLPPHRDALFDLTARQLLGIAGEQLPSGERAALGRFRYGPGVFKIDYAIEGDMPWAAPQCARAGTLHLGGTLDEVAASERQVARGQLPDAPFVLLAQQSVFDRTRAPVGRNAIWAYCHVPHGSAADMTDRIEAQIERFAPGFRDRILARSVRGPQEMEAYNPNYIGGDINGGRQDLIQTYARPTLRRDPYATGARGIYLCSASTPPGGGVHGMCGYHAAESALRHRPA